MELVDQDGSVIHHARTLDLINGKHYELSFKNSVCVRREESPSRILFSSGEYSHSTLYNHPDVTFKPLPYKPSPYPETEIHGIQVFIHPDEDKSWSVIDGSGQQYTFYKNANSRGRLVFQSIDGVKNDIIKRVNDKQKEGYISISGYYTFKASTRELIKS